MTTAQAVETTLTLQSLGDNIIEATVTRWLKKPGDRIEIDEPLLEVATDKVDTEILAPAAGTLVQILAAENEVIQVGGDLAIIGSALAEPPAHPATTSEPVPVSEYATHELVEPLSPLLSVDDSATSALAISEGISTDTDYEKSEEAAPTPPDPSDAGAKASESTAASSAPPSLADDRVERLPRIRQTIAHRMRESLDTSAQLTTVVEVDVSAIVRLRAAQKVEFHRRTGVKLSFLPFFTKAAIEALADHPLINASVNAECTEVTYHGGVHLGIAVDSPKGLMVPVIRDAQRLNIPALAHAIADNANLVRSGKIGSDALTGGTFTITNTGSRGALFDTPIINQPQSAILGIGAVVERVVPHRDSSGAMTFGARSMAYLSISYDHRIIDGADAARFLTSVRRRLETGFTAAELA